MYGKDTYVVIDALVAQIKSLKVDILVKDSEIERLKEELQKKESEGGANG